MKNSKIFDIVKRSGQAFVFKIGGEQWLSDGLAAYSLAGLPEFTEETLLCMFDKTSDDCFPISFASKSIVDFENSKEYEAEISPVIIKWKKKEYVFIKYDINNGFFVNLKYISGFIDDFNYSISVHKNQNTHYLVIKDGVFFCAVVMPSNIIDTGFENRIGDMESVISMRMKDAVDSVAGKCVPEKNMLGGWQNMSGSVEQMEI